MQDNSTWTIPNCSYAEAYRLNGTCRNDNMTIPIICSCICTPEVRVSCCLLPTAPPPPSFASCFFNAPLYFSVFCLLSRIVLLH